jgi:hypothetical protein
MTVFKFDNVFTEEELEQIDNAISVSDDLTVQDHLGRRRTLGIVFSQEILDKIELLVNSAFGSNLTILPSYRCAEYNNEYGNPNLPPHFDGDNADIFFGFQLSSNTDWDIGVDLNTYSLSNNSAIAFNANECIHWRPRKKFEDGEYVKMIFVRLWDYQNPSDYSHKAYGPNHEVFKDVRKLRDSLG